MANTDDKMPPFSIPGNTGVPIIGQSDPLTDFAKKMGLQQMLVMGQRIDPVAKQIVAEFIPYRADTVSQLGMLEYGKTIVTNQIAAQIFSEQEDRACGCDHCASDASGDKQPSEPHIEVLDGGTSE